MAAGRHARKRRGSSYWGVVATMMATFDAFFIVFLAAWRSE